MSDNAITLKTGERGFITGQTGSGKTQGAIWLLKHRESKGPLFILDTKIEPAFIKTLPVKGEKILLINSLEQFKSPKTAELRREADIILIRPSRDEIMNPEALDEYLTEIYFMSGDSTTYIDEVFSLMAGANPGPGLADMLTRGRSKGKTVLMSCQRPARIPVICVSESNKYYVYRLNNIDDRKRMAAYTSPEVLHKPDRPYHFWYYNNGSANDNAEYFRPVNIKTDDYVKPEIIKRKWF